MKVYILKNKEQKRAYDKRYYQKNQKKIRKREKKYSQRPEIKARKKEYNKEYNQRPEVKAKQKEYNQRPEFKAKQKEYYQKNKEGIKYKQKEYYQRPEVKVKKNEYSKRPEVKVKKKEYRQRPKIKKRKNEYAKNKYKINKNFNILVRLRNLFRRALRKYTKTGKIWSASKYGINYKAIIEQLKPFPEDISLYHVDHRKPLCSFDLTDPEEIKKAFAPENHQWLLAFENRSKGGRY